MQAAKERQRGLGAPLAAPAIGAIAAEVIHSLRILTRIEGAICAAAHEHQLREHLSGHGGSIAGGHARWGWVE